MANNWSVWKWTRTGWVIYIYIEKRIFRKFFRTRKTMGIGETRDAESAIIRHVIIRLFVLDDSGIENNWPANIWTTHKWPRIHPTCVCSQMHNHRIVLESECPHSTDFCIALSLSITSMIHLTMFTSYLHLFTRKLSIIALVLQILLFLSLSLSWLNFCVHLFKLFLSVPVFLPVIILYIYIRIYTAIDRERKFTRGTIDKIQRRVVRKVETGKYTMRVFFPSLGRPRAHPSKLRLLFHFALK